MSVVKFGMGEPQSYATLLRTHIGLGAKEIQLLKDILPLQYAEYADEAVNSTDPYYPRVPLNVHLERMVQEMYQGNVPQDLQTAVNNYHQAHAALFAQYM